MELLGAIGLILPAATGVLPILTPIAATGLAIMVMLASHALFGGSVWGLRVPATLSVALSVGMIEADLSSEAAGGSWRRLFDVAEPPGYRGAELLLAADMLGEDGRAGYLKVRGRAERRPGDVGARLGDLLLLLVVGQISGAVLGHQPAGDLGAPVYSVSATR